MMTLFYYFHFSGGCAEEAPAAQRAAGCPEAARPRLKSALSLSTYIYIYNVTLYIYIYMYVYIYIYVYVYIYIYIYVYR